MAIKLYWWQGNRNGKNFGDELSRYTVEYASGNEVEWGSVEKCDLFAIGSVFEQASHSMADGENRRSLFIWGSGMMQPAGLGGHTKYMKISAVRGPLTLSALHQRQIGLAVGDPGILIDRVFDVSRATPKYSVGLIPHHRHTPSSLTIHHRSSTS